jgi:hypothetical protein
MFPLTQPYQPTMVQVSDIDAASALQCSIAAVAGKMNYCTGFDITGGGATGAAIVRAVLSGIAGGSLSWAMGVVAGATAPVNPENGLSVRFPHPIPASAVNTAITMDVESFGAGNTEAAVTLYGFRV